MKCLLLAFIIFPLLVPDPSLRSVAWKKLKTRDEVSIALRKNIPEQASLAQVNAVLSNWNPNFLKTYGDSLIAFISPPENASFLITRKWMIRFHFRNDSLYCCTISEALTGP
jgi:hypothetical protein